MANSLSAHRVNRIEIEVQVSDAEQGETLLERASDLRESIVAPTIDRVCSELSEPTRIDRIARLELDLGLLAFDEFDDDFARKLDSALRTAIAAQLRDRHNSRRSEQASVELLEAFARTGNLPWWAQGRESDLVAAHVRELARSVPDKLCALLRGFAADPLALARVAKSCDGPAIEVLVELACARALGPADLRELYPQLIGVRKSAVDSQGSHLSFRITVLTALAGIGTPLQNVAAEALRHALGFDSHTPAAPTGRIYTRTRSQQPSGSAYGADPENDRMRVDEAVSGMRDTPQRPIVETTTDDAPAVADGPLDEDQPISGDTDSYERARESGEARATSRSGPDSSHELDHRHGQGTGEATPTSLLDFAARPFASVRRSSQASPSHAKAVAAARRHALANLDQLYVDDAGLVLLWPFIVRFFQRVGLLDERVGFVDEHAPMLAIALLEQLAIDDPEPPEFCVPLAKLLCGVSPEEGFALERAPSPEQLAECESLLRAVIDHAPVLRAMPIATFRATFLQRRGVLSIRDGAWLLQVERHTHDVVLDRFPWSWSWIKLPWMGDALQVEW